MKRITTLSELFNPADVIGKTLYARRNIKIKARPTDKDKTIRTVKSGDIVGVVYSWLGPGEGRSKYYWFFKDKDGKNYFAEHNAGDFDFKKLKAQGVRTEEDKQKEKKEEEEGVIITTIKQYGGYVLGLVAIGFVIKLAVNTATKK